MSNIDQIVKLYLELSDEEKKVLKQRIEQPKIDVSNHMKQTPDKRLEVLKKLWFELKNTEENWEKLLEKFSAFWNQEDSYYRTNMAFPLSYRYLSLFSYGDDDIYSSSPNGGRLFEPTITYEVKLLFYKWILEDGKSTIDANKYKRERDRIHEYNFAGKTQDKLATSNKNRLAAIFNLSVDVEDITRLSAPILRNTKFHWEFRVELIYIYHQLILKIHLKPFSLDISERIVSIIEWVLIDQQVSTPFDLGLANLGFKGKVKSSLITSTEQALLIKEKVLDECKKQGLTVSKTKIAEIYVQYVNQNISLSTLKKRNK
jgi:hypothetical protein